ncbi:MAG: TonB-dependent receptor, partial [Terracidiphilus sp.]
DQTGAVVPGASLTLTSQATGFTKTTVSGDTGLYDIGGLNPGNYNLKVTAKGFQSYEQKGIVVNVSMTFRVDVKLTVGAEAQTVTVEADALTVQVDSNVVSTLVSSQQITQLATENRNFAALAALGLGVSSALPSSNTPTSVASNFSISVNGLRQSHNIWLIDGGESDDRGGAGGMQIMPSQDAIAEFQMMTSNYPPDYGISSGATMSLSLKSGTQKYHGTLWEFNRTPAYNAAQALVGQKLNVHYNIFGGNLGGPLFIPHVYNTNKEKTFFFVNEEWRKILTGAGVNVQNTLNNADRPTAGQDLSYVAPAFAKSTVLKVPSVAANSYYAQNVLAPMGLVPGAAPGTAGGFAVDGSGNAVIPHSLFDNNGLLYLNSPAIPKPTNTANDQVVADPANAIDVRDDIFRIDHKFNDKWAILGHFIHDSVTQGNASPMLGWLWASYNSITSTLSNPAYSAAIKLSGTINPNLLVEASMNYDGNIINIINSPSGNLPSGWAANPMTPNFKVTKNSLPSIGYIGPYSVAEDTGSAPWHNAAQDYMPRVDLSYTQGKHAMKFGFSYNRYTKNQQLFGQQQGNYNFGQLSGDSFMDMLMGLSTGYNQFQATPIRHYVNQTPSAYAMDNWHVTPRLSLQLGLRYDALPHAWERNNDVSNFNPANFLSSQIPVWNGNLISSTTQGLLSYNGSSFYVNGQGLAGQNGFPRGLVNNDYRTLQPRVGFSEDLFGDGKTVIRGGFGTFYERLQGNDIYNAATNAPFANNAGISNTYFSSPGLSWNDNSNTASAGLPVFVTGQTSLAHSYPAPAVAQFSLGVQRELSPSVVWVVQYVGNLAWHQNVQRNINTYPLNTDMAVRCDAGDGGNNYNAGAGPKGTGDVCPTSTGGWTGIYVPPVGDGTNGTYVGQPQNLPNGNLYRTYQGWGGISQQENTTNGNYNGFQTGVRIQNRWGLSGEVDYTWSHEIDLTSSDLVALSNPFNPKYDKASGNLDRRQILNINYIYNMPFFAKSSGLTHSLLGGWVIAGTAIDETGVPGSGALNYTGPGVSMSYDSIGLGGGYTNRPNVNGKVHQLKKINQYFDTTQFSFPIPVWDGAPNQGFGNAGRDSIIFPGRVDFTTSLYKNFAIKEAAHIELRFESFNTFNHSEWNNLNTSLGAGTFGQVTGAYDSRTLELGGKFVF